MNNITFGDRTIGYYETLGGEEAEPLDRGGTGENRGIGRGPMERARSVGFYKEYESRMPAVFLPGPEAIQFLEPRLPENKAWELVRAFPAEHLMVEPCEEWATAGE